MIDVCLKQLGETERAIKVTEGIKDATGKEKSVWLPKSQIEIENNSDGTITVTMPDWLYEKSEFMA